MSNPRGRGLWYVKPPLIGRFYRNDTEVKLSAVAPMHVLAGALDKARRCLLTAKPE